MGNQLAQPQKLHSDHLTDFPNVVLKDILGVRLPAVSAAHKVSGLWICTGQLAVQTRHSVAVLRFSTHSLRRRPVPEDGSLRAR